MGNFNNPQNLSLSDVYSTVTATINNPGIEFGDFTSDNPELAALLPKNLNLGITSPGTIHMETECNGLDFMNTNDNFDKLPFSACLNRFNDKYMIPDIAFDNLMNSLPYTFSALSKKDKVNYLKSLQNFIDNEKKPHVKLSHSKKDTIEHFKESEKSGCVNNEVNLTYILYIVIVVLILLCFLCFYYKNK